MRRKYLTLLSFVLVLVLGGCSSSSQMKALEERVASLEAAIEILTTKADEVNVYGSGIYYCQPPYYGIYSIQFVKSDVIRVFGYDDDEISVNRNNYFEVKSTSKGVFELTRDIVLPDTYGIYDLAFVASIFNTNDNLLKTIKISDDHEKLIYGDDPAQHFCLLNTKYVETYE